MSAMEDQEPYPDIYEPDPDEQSEEERSLGEHSLDGHSLDEFLEDNTKGNDTFPWSQSAMFSDNAISSSDIEDRNILSRKRKATATAATMVFKDRPLQLLDLPPEILETIFRYLPFENVAKLRLVSDRFNMIASSLLNSEFQRLRVTMQQRFQSIKAQMPRRESARRKHPLARESDIIETLHMRLTLLQMTFGKHIERKHCCFFAGEILDEVHRILRYVKATPNLNKAYKVTDELFDLSTMAMEYFKEHIEPSLPEITYFGTELFEYPPLAQPSKLPLPVVLDDPSSSSSGSSKPPSIVEAMSPRPRVSLAVNKRLRKLRENMKRNNGQVNALKQDLRAAKRKVSTQQKQIHDLKSRFEDYDKKFQSTSRKISAVVQELNHCKTELQYWRSKSPAAQCSCGKFTPVLEFKENSREPLVNLFHNMASQCDNSLDEEEFNAFFAVIPEYGATPPPESTPVAPLKRSKVKIVPKVKDEKDGKPAEIVARGCKRKLDLEQDDDVLFIKAVSAVDTIFHQE